MKTASLLAGLFLFALCSAMAAAPDASPSPAALTLRALGVKGDGQTDDREALIKALTAVAGQPVDGQGLTYAVDGSVDVRVDVDLRNATFRQTMPLFDTTKYIVSVSGTNPPPIVKPEGAVVKMVDGAPIMSPFASVYYPEDPAITGAELAEFTRMIHCRTLFIHSQNKGETVSIKLDNINILRDNHPENGMHTYSGGLVVDGGKPVSITNVEISGDGKGNGLSVFHCEQVRLKGLNIHDINYALYRGDMVYTHKFLQDEVGWNSSPVYDFDTHQNKFYRVRIQEQANGLVMSDCQDVEIADSRIDHVGMTVEGVFYPWQADGMTISGVKNIVIRDCQISNVWEGIDFTGRGQDGFLEKNIKISDTFSYCFKYAHPQKNGKVVDCTALRANYHAFTIGSESDNIEFLNCTAIDTGLKPYWWHKGSAKNIAGFAIGDGPPGTFARNIVIKNCTVINNVPGTVGMGFSIPSADLKPEYGNRLINPKVQGAVEPYNNFKPETE